MPAGRCADDPKKVFARAWRSVAAALGEGADGRVQWIPAHTSPGDVGKRLKGDGSTLTAKDRLANDRADSLAKQAAAKLRATPGQREEVDRAVLEVREMATWLAEVTLHANAFPTTGGVKIRDSESASFAQRSRKRKADRLVGSSTAAGVRAPFPRVVRRRLQEQISVCRSVAHQTWPPNYDGFRAQPKQTSVRARMPLVVGRPIWPPNFGGFRGQSGQFSMRRRKPLEVDHQIWPPNYSGFRAPPLDWPVATPRGANAKGAKTLTSAAASAASPVPETAALEDVLELQQSGLAVTWPKHVRQEPCHRGERPTKTETVTALLSLRVQKPRRPSKICWSSTTAACLSCGPALRRDAALKVSFLFAEFVRVSRPLIPQMQW